MKPRTIVTGKKVSFYFLVVLLCAMIYNMVTNVIEQLVNPYALYKWYWAILTIAGIYAVPLLVVFIIHMVFRSKAKHVKKR